MYVITGLNRSTLYNVRLYCLYGSTAGPSTEWFGAATRTGNIMLLIKEFRTGPVTGPRPSAPGQYSRSRTLNWANTKLLD